MRTLMLAKPARLLLLATLGLLLSQAAKAGGPYSFFPLTPCRVIDTRNAVGPTGGPALASGTVRNFPIIAGNTCGIPSTAKAAALNLTIVSPNDLGDLRIFPYQTPVPLASIINFSTADYALANGAIIPLANIGGLDISVQTDMMSTTGTVNLVIDVTGYFQ